MGDNILVDNENIQAAIKGLDEKVLSTLIGYSSNIHNNISSVLEGILNTLIGDGNNIQGNIAEALEGILKARKESLDKVDNKPGNIVYPIEAMCLVSYLNIS